MAFRSILLVLSFFISSLFLTQTSMGATSTEPPEEATTIEETMQVDVDSVVEICCGFKESSIEEPIKDSRAIIEDSIFEIWNNWRTCLVIYCADDV